MAIVILSDENERSKGGDIAGFALQPRDLPATLVANIKGQFGADKSFAVHAVIVRPGDTDCLEKQNAQNGVKGFEGHVYQELVDLTGGHSGSICADDYGIELGQIGSAVVDEVNSVDLECAPLNSVFQAIVSPEPAGLEVELDAEDKKIRFNQSLPADTTVRLIYDCQS